MTAPDPTNAEVSDERLREGDAEFIQGLRLKSRSLWEVVHGQTPWIDRSDAQKIAQDFDSAIQRLHSMAMERDLEITRLREILLWVDHYEPELVAAAEKQFGAVFDAERKFNAR